ncbi:hypothetical protein NVP1110O_65 [Vibrio phage 1.110.O._10N.261.52.C1]|nr:hypothetical protein NVP1110O_65 [Vibrio phage 1.110.O._10N.261.52.C1]
MKEIFAICVLILTIWFIKNEPLQDALLVLLTK